MNKPADKSESLVIAEIYNRGFNDCLAKFVDTHPVKELTDDEIMDYVEAFSVDMGNYYEFQPDNVLQMIRSILDEAQEK